MPGLKKAAFVIGGEYGKGLMSCRHNGAWSAPVFMRGRQRQLGTADRRAVDRSRAARDERERHGENAPQQGDARRRGVDRRRSGGPGCARRDRRADESGNSVCTRARRDCLPASTCPAASSSPTLTTTPICMARTSQRRDVVMGTSVKAPAVTEPFMAALKRASEPQSSLSRQPPSNHGLMTDCAPEN